MSQADYGNLTRQDIFLASRSYVPLMQDLLEHGDSMSLKLLIMTSNIVCLNQDCAVSGCLSKRLEQSYNTEMK